jgi:uncharacterized membrane protein
MENIKSLVEAAAIAIELVAVAIIVSVVFYGVFHYLFKIFTKTDIRDRYSQLRTRLGRALLLGLEILVAADIIRTVALEPTLLNVAVLGLLVLIRTFLSWSLEVEIEGHWPWRSGREPLPRSGEGQKPTRGKYETTVSTEE